MAGSTAAAGEIDIEGLQDEPVSAHVIDLTGRLGQLASMDSASSVGEAGDDSVVQFDIAKERAEMLLNPETRTVWQLFSEGMSNADIAATLGITTNNVRHAMRQASARVAAHTDAIMAGGSDYAAMSQSRSRNVLGFLDQIGAEISPTARQHDLYALADSYLAGAATIPDREKAIVREVYNLGDVDSPREASLSGTSRSFTNRVAKQVLSVLALSLEKPLPEAPEVDGQPLTVAEVSSGEALGMARTALREGHLGPSGYVSKSADAYAPVLLTEVRAQLEESGQEEQSHDVERAVMLTARLMLRYSQYAGVSGEGNIGRDTEIALRMLSDIRRIRDLGVAKASNIACYASPEEVAQVIKKYASHPDLSAATVSVLIGYAPARPEGMITNHLQRIRRAREVFASSPYVTDYAIRRACLRQPGRWVEVLDEFAAARQKGVTYQSALSTACRTVERRKAELTEQDRRRQFELSDDPSHALATLRGFVQEHATKLYGALNGLTEYADQLYEELVGDDQAFKLVEHFGDELRGLCIAFARPLLRYRAQYELPATRSELEMLHLFLNDVETLRKMGLGKADRAALYFSPDVMREIYDLYPELGRKLINEIAGRNKVDPAAALDRYAEAVVWGNERFAGNPYVTPGVIRVFCRHYPDSYKANLEKYASQMETAGQYLANRSPISKDVLHRLAKQRPDDIVEAIEAWSARSAELRRRYPSRQNVPQKFLNYIATLKPSSSDIAEDAYVDELDGHIASYLENLHAFREEFRHMPLVTHEVLVLCLTHRRMKPRVAIEGYLENMARFAIEFADDPDVIELVAQDYAASYCTNYASARHALLRWKSRLEANRKRFQYNADVDEEMLKEVSRLWIRQPEVGVAILSYRRRVDRLSLQQEIRPDSTLNLLGGIAARNSIDETPGTGIAEDDRVSSILSKLDPDERIAVLLSQGIETFGSLGLTEDDITFDIAGVAARAMSRLRTEATYV
jgi:DNA-binding CsgD family transcriptional regulator